MEPLHFWYLTNERALKLYLSANYVRYGKNSNYCKLKCGAYLGNYTFGHFLIHQPFCCH